MFTVGGTIRTMCVFGSKGLGKKGFAIRQMDQSE